MSLLIGAVVVYGFNRTVGPILVHPALPRPVVLYVHAAMFYGWIAFFILQSAAVRMRLVHWHRTIGWFGAVLGAAMIIVGVATSITMGRFNLANFHPKYARESLLISLFDITAFSIPFVLAVYWRKTAEYHRRLVLMATCALTAAAFGRFPVHGFPPVVFLYLGVDVLIALGMARDLIVNRRIHPVYAYGLPAFVVGQMFVRYTVMHHSALWLKIAHAILS